MMDKTLDQAYKEYWQNGWIVVNGVFSNDEINRLLEVSEGYIKEEIKSGEIHSVDKKDDGEILPRKLSNPYGKYPIFGEFLANENLQNLLAHFVNPTISLVSDQIFCKPPQIGSPKPYHQDNAYFKCTPADELITAWVALDDVDQENGCLFYQNGTHRSSIVEHEQCEKDYDMEIKKEFLKKDLERPAIVKKGGVVFHHGNTMHCSGENRSNRWRRAYATHWATQNIHTDSPVIKKGYFKNFQPIEKISC